MAGRLNAGPTGVPGPPASLNAGPTGVPGAPASLNAGPTGVPGPPATGPRDPFALLSLEPRFDIDLAAVETRHRELSRALHPDRYSGRPPAERRLALERAIEVNSAWRALRDPVKRAEALLARGGVELDERNEPRPSPELLMEMMEVREELALVRERRDAEALRRLGGELETRERALTVRLATEFATAGTDGDKLRALLPLVGELRYLRRFFEAYAAVEEELAA